MRNSSLKEKTKMKKKSIAIIYYTKCNHSQMLANEIIKGVELNDLNATPICLGEVQKNFDDNIDKINTASGILFGTPTYFGSMAANLKVFMEMTLDLWFKQLWLNKLAGGFVHSSSLSGDKLNVLVQIAIFASQHGMIWKGLDLLPRYHATKSDIEKYKLQEYVDLLVKEENSDQLVLNRLGSWTGFMAQSRFESNECSPHDLATAKYFGISFAEIAKKLA